MATLIQFLQTTLARRESGLPNATQRILLKEALQALVLDFLYNHPQYRSLNFYGGTCLRNSDKAHTEFGVRRTAGGEKCGGEGIVP